MNIKCLFGCLVFLLSANIATAQLTEGGFKTEAGEFDAPLDDIVEKRIVSDRRVLPYDPVREADIFWEKRIWRVLDVREKLNLPFGYPEKPFFSILMKAAEEGEITVYGTEDDKFSYPLAPDEVASMGATVDTIIAFDPETYEEEITIVRNDLNPEDIKQFRLKEIWFFDEESSTLQVRVLGIAPLKDEYDENGNYKYTTPLFWAYYPECREIMARHKVFNPENDADQMTWEDLFERRQFSSYIMKRSNVYDRKVEDYSTGVDMLLEAEKIRMEIFNFEHDLWSY
ncbi:MAG: gliding motility protein GldN [Bacteroidota bacterium]